MRAPPLPLGLTLALVACGGGEATPPPKAPDIQPLLDRFDTVDGLLDGESARALVEDGLSDVATLAVIGALMVELDSATDELGDATEERQALTAESPQGLARASQSPARPDPMVGQRAYPLDVSAGSWARLTHICPGADRSVVDRGNGAIELSTVFDLLEVLSDGLERVVVWGEAKDCLLSDSGDLFTLDADITGAMATNATNDLLLSLVGTLAPLDGGDASPFALDVRQVQATEDGDFQPRYELLRAVDGNGTFLIGVEALDDTASRATLTDRDGTWICDFDTEAEAGACTRGDEVLTWP